MGHTTITRSPLTEIEARCRAHMEALCAAHPDPSHDMSHVERVVLMARRLGKAEGGDLEVIVPAAWLHDCVYVAKNDPRRREASRLSAELAAQLLRDWGYPEVKIPGVTHAIASHSFSAGIEAQSLEARIVQDADRLDALGAIGIFRCLAFSGLSKRPLYDSRDPFGESRTLDDQSNTLDHFYVKLLKLPERLHTMAAREEGARRLRTMEAYLDALKTEVPRI